MTKKEPPRLWRWRSRAIDANRTEAVRSRAVISCACVQKHPSNDLCHPACLCSRCHLLRHDRLFDTDPRAAKPAPALSADAFMAVVTAAVSGLAGHVGVGRHPVELVRYDQCTRTAVVAVHARSLLLVHSALVLFGSYGGQSCRFEIAEFADRVPDSPCAMSENVPSADHTR